MKKFNQFLEQSYTARENLNEAIPTGALLRGAGKLGTKAIPLVGNVLSAVEAGQRASRGDWGGAALSALGAVPGPIGYAAMGADIGREIANSRASAAQPQRPRPTTAVRPATTQPQQRPTGMVRPLGNQPVRPSTPVRPMVVQPQQRPSAPQQPRITSAVNPSAKPPQQTPASSVLAKLKGQTGTLSGGKFTPTSWSSSQSQRYAAYGGR